MSTNQQDLDFRQLSFGKFIGRTPADIAEIEPSYVVWLYETIKPRVCSEALYRDCKTPPAFDHEDLIDTFYRFTRCQT